MAFFDTVNTGHFVQFNSINHLKTQLNPICHLLALLGARHIHHVSRVRVNQKIQKENCLFDVQYMAFFENVSTVHFV
jgi:hypothetical protein